MERMKKYNFTINLNSVKIKSNDGKRQIQVTETNKINLPEKISVIDT